MTGRRFGLGRRVRILGIFIAIVVGAVLFVFLRADLGSLLSALGKANYFFLLLAFGAYIFTTVNLAARWRISLSATGHSVRLHNLWLAVFGSIFINNLTPFTYSGGDPVARVYLLRKTQRVPYSSGSASVMSEYLLDLPVSISLLMMGILLFFSKPLAKLVVVTIWIAVIILLFTLILYFFPKRTGASWLGRSTMRILKAFRRPASRRKVIGGVKRFYASAQAITSTPKIALSVFFFAVITWGLALSRLFFVFQALGFDPPLPMLLLGITLPPMAGLIPLLPAGLGLVDATYVSIFVLFGASWEIAVLATLIERVISLVFGTIIGACALSYLGISVWARQIPKA
ncbi:MAG: flippase-like domain-containing protein [Candidatus Hadarchaeaceae archaeon]